MDNPVSEIPSVIQTLCTARPSTQRKCIETYFTPTASFTHPLCRTGSSNYSRWLIIQIYAWYKVLSPHIGVNIDSVAFDEAQLLLYVSIRQIFKIPIIPFYQARVKLVTVLGLVEASTSTAQSQFEGSVSEKPFFKSSTEADLWTSTESTASTVSRPQPDAEPSRSTTKYFIQSQNDLYQTTEWIKFAVPWGVGVTVIMIAQSWATFFCVLGAALGLPITWLRENVIGGNAEEIPVLRRQKR